MTDHHRLYDRSFHLAHIYLVTGWEPFRHVRWWCMGAPRSCPSDCSAPPHHLIPLPHPIYPYQLYTCTSTICNYIWILSAFPQLYVHMKYSMTAFCATIINCMETWVQDDIGVSQDNTVIGIYDVAGICSPAVVQSLIGFMHDVYIIRELTENTRLEYESLCTDRAGQYGRSSCWH